MIDLALARRLEAADASAGVEYSRAHAQLCPEEGATSIQVAGGYAVYAGQESPLTQAVGQGLGGVVGEDELDEMEAFFKRRNALVAIEVCPLADVSLLKMLGARQYRLNELTDKLFMPLKPDEQIAPPPEGDVRIRQAAPVDAELWASTVGRGFFEGEEPPRLYLEIFRISFRMRTGVGFLAEVGGQVAGGGFLKMDAGTAALSTASVLPAWRGRGVQTALLRARLAYAARQGCDLATITTRLNTTSHRNAERLGFRVAYTRPKMIKM